MIYLASFVGNFLGIAFLSWVIETFSFKQQKPTGRAAWTVGIITGLDITAILAFDTLNGATLAAIAIELAAGALVFVWFRHRYEKKWSDGPREIFE